MDMDKTDLGADSALANKAGPVLEGVHYVLTAERARVGQGT